MPLGSPKSSPKTSCRLHHFLAQCGVGSRRASERLIASGRVTVNGVTIRHQGLCIDPSAQQIAVDGRLLSPQSKVYLVLHKPRNVVCTARDPQARRTFQALLPEALRERVYSVGRLDRDSEGLLLVTNDGDLAHALMHPRHNIAKTYLVWTKRRLSAREEQLLRAGIRSRGEHLELDLLERQQDAYRVGLHTGRNRQIRRMFAAVGVGITRLQRVAVGPLQLGTLRAGDWRYLAARELKALWDAVGHQQAVSAHQKSAKPKCAQREALASRR